MVTLAEIGSFNKPSMMLYLSIEISVKTESQRRHTLVVRLALMVLRIAVLLNLITGILFWTGNADPLQSVHIILGIIAILDLWALAIFQGLKNGSFGLVLFALVVGLLLGIGGSSDRLAPRRYALDHSSHSSLPGHAGTRRGPTDQWPRSPHGSKGSSVATEEEG
jgi:hypothetical protein